MPDLARLDQTYNMHMNMIFGSSATTFKCRNVGQMCDQYGWFLDKVLRDVDAIWGLEAEHTHVHTNSANMLQSHDLLDERRPQHERRRGLFDGEKVPRMNLGMDELG